MSQDWFESLDKDELISLLPANVATEVKFERGARKIADDLAKKELLPLATIRVAPAKKAAKKVAVKAAAKKAAESIPEKTRPAYESLWAAIKGELGLLICTNDPKYRSVRSDLNKAKGKPGLTTVSIITAAISAFVGAEYAVVGPFVAYCLLALVHVGVNAVCAVWMGS